MATFIEELWGSIFTPGPTPPLLVATNAAFAALQAIFLALLLATYSIHFLMLSFISAGLWWAINWFANEVRVAQAREEEEKRKQVELSSAGLSSDADEAGDSMNSGDDTETEVEEHKIRSSGTIVLPQTTTTLSKTENNQFVPQKAEGIAMWHTGAAARLAPGISDDAPRRRTNLAASTGDLSSTDSEWDKMDDER